MFRRMPGEKNKSWSVSLKRFPFFSGCIVKVVVLTVVLLTTTKIQAQLVGDEKPKSSSTSDTARYESPSSSPATSGYKGDSSHIKNFILIGDEPYDDLSIQTREQFDQVYKEFLSAQKKLLAFDKKVREGNTPLGEALKRLPLIERELIKIDRQIATFNQSFRVYKIRHNNPKASLNWWYTILQAGDWTIREKLAEDKKFRPLISWWAESVFTDVKKKAFVFPKHIIELLPPDHATNPKTKLTREEYLKIYLTMWKRHSNLYVDKLKAAREGFSIPQKMENLLIKQREYRLQKQICSGFIFGNMPESELGNVHSEFSKAFEKCSATWPDWITYQREPGRNELSKIDASVLNMMLNKGMMFRYAQLNATGDSWSTTKKISKYYGDHPRVKGITPVNAETIHDLPVKTQALFDKAYRDYKKAQSKYFKLTESVEFEDNLLGKALRWRRVVSKEASEIHKQLDNIPGGWRTYYRSKDPKVQLWLNVLLRANVYKTYQKLADEEEFRPLLAWWAEFVLTLDPPGLLCEEEDIKGLLPENHNQNPESKLTHEEYLIIYLKIWKRYSERHMSELQAAEKEVSVPPRLAELLIRKVRNSLQHELCTAYKCKYMPTPELVKAKHDYTRTSKICSAIWPQWHEYYKKLREKREAEEEILIQQIREMKRISRQKKRVPN